MDWFIIWIAKWMGYALFFSSLFLIFFLPPESRLAFALQMIGAAVLARFVLTELIRLFYKRPRPYEKLNAQPLFQQLEILPDQLLRVPGFSYLKRTAAYSFPSGHVAFYGAISFMILWHVGAIGWIFLGGTVVMGMARVVAGLHWFSDILAGFVMGVFGAALVGALWWLILGF